MPRAVAVAFSGGRDSTALLHATAAACRGLGVAVHALHVHHGLSAHADAWLAHCRAQCLNWRRRGLTIEFHHAHVEVPRHGGAGIEAEARTRRYAALARMALAASCETVLLAHHREDQGETFLLQALRGAGVAGLAAMPATVIRDGVQWLRPWLDRPRAAIEAYLRRHRLRFIDDDSNGDPRFARNRLRLEVLPALDAAFDGAAARLAQAARWQGDALTCLDALARIDLLALARDDEALDLVGLMALGAPRGRNALRAWLQVRLGQVPGAAEFDRLWSQIDGRAPARWPLAQGGELRRYRGALSLVAAESAQPRAAMPRATLSIRRAGVIRLPDWNGELHVRRVRSGGVALARLATVELRSRHGGEQFQRAKATPPRSLKKQFQLHGVPAWARVGPLVWADGLLLFVPGLGIDARVQAQPGEAQVGLEWIASAEPRPAA